MTTKQKRGRGRPTPGDRSRKNKLEADLLELKLLEKKGELLRKERVKLAWSSALIEFRQLVNNQNDLSLKQRADFLKALSEIDISKYISK